MARLVWHETGTKLYETGISHGVLYLRDADHAYTKGVAWQGLTSVDENPSGAEPTPLYADDIKYLVLMSVEEFGYTINAYSYPTEFEACDGTKDIAPGIKIGQQVRESFGFSYRTIIGSDTEGNDYGYKLHLVYGCTASPSDKTRSTVNDTPEAAEFSWEVTCIPVEILGFRPTANVVINSTEITPQNLALIEAILYGSASSPGNATGGTVVMYTDLAAIEGTLTSADAGRGWLVSSTNTVYVWNGTEFPAEGTGVAYVAPTVEQQARLPLPQELVTLVGAGGMG